MISPPMICFHSGFVIYHYYYTQEETIKQPFAMENSDYILLQKSMISAFLGSNISLNSMEHKPRLPQDSISR